MWVCRYTNRQEEQQDKTVQLLQLTKTLWSFAIKQLKEQVFSLWKINEAHSQWIRFLAFTLSVIIIIIGDAIKFDIYASSEKAI